MLIDLDQLNERFCGDREEIGEVAAAVRDELSACSGQLNQCLQSGDRERMKRLLHALKSSLWSVCATEPWEAAGRLHADAALLSDAELRTRFAELQSLLDRLSERLAGLVSGAS